MVQDAGWTTTGSSSEEYEITFEIPPPTEVRPKSPFPLPVIAAVRSLPETSTGGSGQQLVAHASLRDETGSSAAPGLTGSLTSSVRSRSGNTASGYGRFDPLLITQPGRYRLRIMLGIASVGGMMTKSYVDSDIITVHDEARNQRPTPSQITRLRCLIPENIDIRPEDIEDWQRLS
ncbi:hypothetical protein ATEIFO6365_0003045000 [Aspergillus terreus]|uniref:Uncharacterized protein n=1 Tax=Aspergillus terreus TaxID=33178 RepID=A0A5M3YRN4_ASPTE|nr:hypothetical protein ATETN484_0003039500 [Aspergillus terreus]GFF14384.1 hypothetical protein ATEIFO6365_0003045000 [Aspergillus terreus]